MADYLEMKPFFDYLKKEVNNRSIYSLGMQGQIAGTLTIDKITSNEDSLKNAARVLKHVAELLPDTTWKRNVARAFDCSGLGCYYFQDQLKFWKYDHRANDMYKECVSIPVDKRQPGDFVFGHFTSEGRAGHVGYIDDEGMVIEAKGRDDGVVRRAYTAGDWTKVGRPSFWIYNMTRELKAGMKGEDVGQLQARLTHLGYPCGTIDNDFGKKTATALELWQKAYYKKAPEYGVMDKKTAKKLGFTFKK